jgi:phage terminase large subunit-like protein
LDPWQQEILRMALREDTNGEGVDRWAAFEVGLVVGRQNGKGTILEARELAGLFHFGERLILHSAHEFKTATEAFRRVLSLVDNTDHLRKLVKKVQVGHGDEGIELRSGARLRFVARSTGSGRGFSGDCVILDEAYALTAKQLQALLPTLSARPNPQLWYTSSPSLDGASGAELMRIRDRGSGATARLAYFDYGAPGDLDHLEDLDLDDVELWKRCNPSFGIRISEDFVRAERAAMTPEGFARERLGVWPAPVIAGGAIDVAKWIALLDAGSSRSGDVACAVDISPLRDYAAIVMYGPRADGVGHAQVVRYHPGTDWIIPAIAEIQAKLTPVAWGMGTGTYKSLREELAKIEIVTPADGHKPARGDICLVAGGDMAAACGQIIDAVKQGSLRHVSDSPLENAVRGAKLRQTGDVVAWARKESAVDISPLVGLTLARWAYMTRIEAIQDTYLAANNIW